MCRDAELHRLVDTKQHFGESLISLSMREGCEASCAVSLADIVRVDVVRFNARTKCDAPGHQS